MSVIELLFGWLYLPEYQLSVVQRLLSVVGIFTAMFVIFAVIVVIGMIYSKVKERKKRKK